MRLLDIAEHSLMSVYYVGIASSFHDPSISIVGPDGSILLAESTERPLQYKRAIGCPADLYVWFQKYIETYCEKDAEIVLANGWSQRYQRLNKLSGLLGRRSRRSIEISTGRLQKTLLKDYVSAWLSRSQYKAVDQFGDNAVFTFKRDFGKNIRDFRHFDHHLSHAAMACWGSGYDEATCMVVDGYGEVGSIRYFDYADGEVDPLDEQRGAESLGLFYSWWATVLCGFDPLRGEEWKVMGLAPYGKVIDEVYGLLQTVLKIDGLHLRYASMDHLNEVLAKLEKFALLPGSPPMDAADLARTFQEIYSDWMTELLQNLADRTKSRNLVLCGGCGLNSAFNGRIVPETSFESLYVPSAPGDDGVSVGAALLAYREDHPDWKPAKEMQTPYLGSRVSTSTLEQLETLAQVPNCVKLTDSIFEVTARLLSEGLLVGWCRGRAEFGPRALGNRSILADPRKAEMKEKINAMVKFREAYRPFAPSVLTEHAEAYFEHYQESPYMEKTLKVRPGMRDGIAGVVHVDGTARLQTVRKDWNPDYYRLIEAFHQLTEVPILLNTSFNIMGKPIIHSVEDALGMFYTTGLDVLVIEDYLITKQPVSWLNP